MFRFYLGKEINAAEFYSSFDLLLTPTVAEPPFVTGALHPRNQMPKAQYLLMKLLAALRAGWVIKASGAIEKTVENNFEHFPYTPIFNVTGQPAMSIPLQWNDKGLPIGMQFVGRYADEATLFRIAGQLEKAKPWKDRVPPISGGNA